jgi:ribosomal protein S13
LGYRGVAVYDIPFDLIIQGAGILTGIYLMLWRRIKSLESNGLKRIEKTVDKIEGQLDEHIRWHIEGKKKGPF